MRLSHPELTDFICWKENQIPVLVLESPVQYRKTIFELSSQAAGEEGEFVLSLDYEPLDCADHLHVIRDYFSLTLDDRKLQNRFQTLLWQLIWEELAAQTDHLQQEILTYLQTLSLHLDYPVSPLQGDYIQPLLKAVRYQISLEEMEPLEQLMEYIKLYSALMKHQCFILVGAHSYFSSAELLQLYQMAFYQKWRILLIEPKLDQFLPAEEVILLDQDFCELWLDAPDLML